MYTHMEAYTCVCVYQWVSTLENRKPEKVRNQEMCGKG